MKIMDQHEQFLIVHLLNESTYNYIYYSIITTGILLLLIGGLLLIRRLCQFNTLRMREGLYQEHIIIHNIILNCINRLIEEHAEDFEFEDQATYLEFVELVLELQDIHHNIEDQFLFPKLFREQLSKFNNGHNTIHQTIERVTISLDLIRESSGVEMELEFQDLRRELIKLKYESIMHFKQEEETISSHFLNTRYTLAEQQRILEAMTRKMIKQMTDPKKCLPLFLYSMRDEDRKRYVTYLPWITRHISIPYLWKQSYINLTPYFFNYSESMQIRATSA
jgi:hypothetical protein